MQHFSKITLSIISIAFLTGCGASVNAVSRGEFGQFERSLNNTTHGYQVIEDPTGTAPTLKVERFEVRGGDCSQNKYWSDCKNDRERSELSGPKNNLLGSEWWYGWSIYLPHDFEVVDPVSVMFGQFHQRDKDRPAFSFKNDGGGLYLSRDLHASQHWSTILTDQEMRGAWNHIEVHAKWSQKSDGFFDVYANGELKKSYRGPTTSAEALYFKYGIYRTFISKYLTKNNAEEVPTQIVLYANVRRSKTREELKSQ